MKTSTSQPTRAIANVKKICEEHLKGRYELQVIGFTQFKVFCHEVHELSRIF